jgi:23S rRNA (uracil1939-C5)-methyltransferase
MSKDNRHRGFDRVITHATCVDLTYEGKGVCKVEQGVVFVTGMFPLDEGDIEISYKRAGQLFGRLVKLTKPSVDRVPSLCPVCNACGGCDFQAYAYKAQLLFKQAKVKEQFHRIGHLDVEPLPTLGMEHPYFYRNKIQPLLGADERGNVYSGFYKEGSHVIVPIEKCYIEDERATKILVEIRKLMKSMRIPPYFEDDGYGVMRHILIKTSYYYKEIMVVLVTACDSFPGRNNFVHALLEVCPEITTIVQNINSRHTSIVLGGRNRVLFGKGYIQDKLCDVHFRISAKSFYQTNPVMTEILYKTAMDFAELAPTDVVFDAYSGIGTIGLIAAKKVKKVISVEIVEEAVNDAIHNARDNDITNFEAYADDATNFIYKMINAKEKIDVLFMDPPRKGSDERFLKAVKTLLPKKVIYVSCDPSSLARDVAYLSSKYEIGKIQPVDMFPQTYHVETVCELSLRNADKN